MNKEEFEKRFQEIIVHCKTQQTSRSHVQDFKDDLSRFEGRVGEAMATTAFLENYLEHLLHDLFEEFVVKEQQNVADEKVVERD